MVWVSGKRVAPPVYRALGTCDIDGNGTALNLPCGSAFECAGPFVLLDVVSMPKVAMFRAPFCAHPHAGAAVRTFLPHSRYAPPPRQDYL